MIVEFTPRFKQYLRNFPETDRQKISAFVTHVQQYGLTGLKGRNKNSDNVPTNDPNWSERVAYAQKYQLWHYHIGIPNYELSERGDYVSEYILHYIREEQRIIIVDMSPHPPFQLPDIDYLK
ncbi:hypothetical protein [Moraxella sp. ZY210820]|uniref:hypothetical protein n=1 Tax=unclassified Moraxella TaxID=2685852 RepID=UPI00272F50A0|nr:hypothetical protein [Moraxella sp. ZY210820]WLF84400.1 hypothetical protein LU301_02625 [Moraxella sp. ZY210820]